MAGHNSKWAQVNFERCNPLVCDPNSGVCKASLACEKGLLEQEDLCEPPMLVSQTMCKGCGFCVAVCPLKAISIECGI